MQALRTESQLGFCEYRDQHDFRELELTDGDCCPEQNMTHICFGSHFEEVEKFGCLHARKIIESSDSFCKSNKDCNDGSKCILPIVNDSFHERLLIIRHANERVLFLGDPFELNPPTLVLINLVPRHWIVPKFAPIYFLKIVDYILVYSLGMAFFNALPCVILDGNHISTSLIELFISNEDKRILLRVAVNTIGTFLIVLFVSLQTIRFAFS